MSTDISVIIRAVDRFSGPMRGLDRSMQRLAASQRRMQATMSAGIGGIVAFSSFRTALDKTVGSAMRFESAMADVKKVIDATPEAFGELSDGILAMSKRIPVAVDGLASITAAAGQAGIATQDLLGFTEEVAKSSFALGIAADQTGDVFAKLGNVFQLDLDGIRDLADGANHLSNNFAASGEEILDFTNRAAGAARALNLSVAELQASGAAMVASGIVPETAARGLNAMATRLAVGGPKIDRAFKRMGWSFGEWRKLRDKSGPEAMTEMFQAIAKLDKDEAAALLKDLVGQDFSDDFSKLITNPDLLAEAFSEMANEADRAGSVQREFEVRSSTTANALELLRNNLAAIGNEIGSRFLPGIARLSTRMTEFLRGLDTGAGLDDFAENMQAVGDAVRGLAGGNLSSLRDLGAALESLVAPLGEMGSAAVGLGIAALWAAGRGLVGLGIAVAMSPIVRIGAMATAIGELAKALKDAKDLGDVAEHFRGMSTGMQALTAFGAALVGGKMLRSLGGVASAVGAFAGRKFLMGAAILGGLMALTSGASAGDVGATIGQATGIDPKIITDGAAAAKGMFSGLSGPVLGALVGAGGIAAALTGGWLTGRARRRRQSADNERLIRRGAAVEREAEERAARIRQVNRGARVEDLMNERGLSEREAIRIAAAESAAAQDDVRRRTGEAVGIRQNRDGTITDTRREEAAREARREARIEADAELERQRRIDEARARAAAYEAPNRAEPGRQGFRPYTPEEQAAADQVRRDREFLRSQGIDPRGRAPTPSAPSPARPGRVPGLRPGLGAAIAGIAAGVGATAASTGSAQGSTGDRPQGGLAELIYSFTEIARMIRGRIAEDPEGFARRAQLLSPAAMIGERIGSSIRSESGGVGGESLPDLERIVELYRELGRLQAMPGSRPIGKEIREITTELAGLTADMPEIAALGETLAASIRQGGAQAQVEAAAIEAKLRTTFASIASTAASSGAQIGPQLAAGIRAGIPAVAAAANEMAATVANRLPQSPVKEGPLVGLPEMGRKIVSMLASGMDTALAAGAADRVAGAIAGGLQPGAGRVGVAAAGVGAGGITIHMGGVQIHGAGTGRDAAEEFARELEGALQSALSDIGIGR